LLPALDGVVLKRAPTGLYLSHLSSGFCEAGCFFRHLEGFMSKFSPLETGTARSIVAVSVFPKQEDHAALRSIFRDSEWPICPSSRWTLNACKNLDEALPILESGRIPVVLCERDLRSGTWKDMVEALAPLPNPPYLIVASRQADERLWAEALNLGAYDVLPIPFNTAEVVRTLSVAWVRWIDQHRPMLTRVAKSVA
jgi:CheY-like chemotaxis protein